MLKGKVSYYLKSRIWKIGKIFQPKNPVGKTNKVVAEHKKMSITLTQVTT
jgi:hypothetical protein